MKRKQKLLDDDWQTPIVEPSMTDRAWMAGFMDGEGTITIGKHHRKDRPTDFYFRPYISVANTVPAAFEPFKRFYGGYIFAVHEYRKNPQGKKWSDAWTWRCTEKQMPRMLSHLHPFLIVKRKQCELLIEFLSRKRPDRLPRVRGRWGGSAPLSPEEYEWRGQLHQSIRYLNRRCKQNGE